MSAQEDGVQPMRLEIHGVVLESGTDQPIPGAEVSVFAQPSGAAPESLAKAATDSAGAFDILMSRPGRYRVEARKSGYEAPGSGPSAVQEVELEERYPLAEVKLCLGHFGALTGKVVDGDGKPIPDLRLDVVRERDRGPRFPPAGPEAKTDADGRFTASGLAPGNYAAEVFPQTGARERILTTFTEADAEKVDLDYERAYWPGGHGAEGALPVAVAGGATVDIGTLRAHKIPYYRVHVRIPVAQCDAGDSMSVFERVRDSIGSGSIQPLGQAPCDQDILVTGYLPGTYRLVLRVPGEHGSSASVPFVIADGNITVAALLLADVTVDGAVVSAEGAGAPDFTKLSVMLSPADWAGGDIIGGDIIQPWPVASDGKFQIPYVRPVGQSVSVRGLDATHYVKEIRYNGRALSGSTVPLEGATAPSLTIVLDDKPAAIAGRVENVSGAMVIAVKWPVDWSVPGGGGGKAQADANGSFLITGLSPGEYRVIALPALPDLMGVSQAAIERIFAGAESLDLTSGETLNVTLEPTVLPAQPLQP